MGEAAFPIRILLVIIFLLLVTVGILALIGSSGGIWNDIIKCEEDPPKSKFWCPKNETSNDDMAIFSTNALACAINAVTKGEFSEKVCPEGKKTAITEFSFLPGVLAQKPDKLCFDDRGEICVSCFESVKLDPYQEICCREEKANPRGGKYSYTMRTRQQCQKYHGITVSNTECGETVEPSKKVEEIVWRKGYPSAEEEEIKALCENECETGGDCRLEAGKETNMQYSRPNDKDLSCDCNFFDLDPYWYTFDGINSKSAVTLAKIMSDCAKSSKNYKGKFEIIQCEEVDVTPPPGDGGGYNYMAGKKCDCTVKTKVDVTFPVYGETEELAEFFCKTDMDRANQFVKENNPESFEFLNEFTGYEISNCQDFAGEVKWEGNYPYTEFTCWKAKKEMSCSVYGFNLPEEFGTLDPKAKISGFGDPFYLVYAEHFPEGEDSSWSGAFTWAEGAMNILIWAIPAGPIMKGTLKIGGKALKIFSPSIWKKATGTPGKAIKNIWSYTKKKVDDALARPGKKPPSKLAAGIGETTLFLSEKSVFKGISHELFAWQKSRWVWEKIITRYNTPNKFFSAVKPEVKSADNWPVVKKTYEDLYKNIKPKNLDEVDDREVLVESMQAAGVVSLGGLLASIMECKELKKGDADNLILQKALWCKDLEGLKMPDIDLEFQTYDTLNTLKYPILLEKPGEAPTQLYFASPCKTDIRVSEKTASCDLYVYFPDQTATCVDPEIFEKGEKAALTCGFSKEAFTGLENGEKIFKSLENVLTSDKLLVEKSADWKKQELYLPWTGFGKAKITNFQSLNQKAGDEYGKIFEGYDLYSADMFITGATSVEINIICGEHDPSETGCCQTDYSGPEPLTTYTWETKSDCGNENAWFIPNDDLCDTKPRPVKTLIFNYSWWCSIPEKEIDDKVPQARISFAESTPYLYDFRGDEDKQFFSVRNTLNDKNNDVKWITFTDTLEDGKINSLDIYLEESGFLGTSIGGEKRIMSLSDSKGEGSFDTFATHDCIIPAITAEPNNMDPDLDYNFCYTKKSKWSYLILGGAIVGEIALGTVTSGGWFVVSASLLAAGAGTIESVTEASVTWPG
jgi:hypothetical protein